MGIKILASYNMYNKTPNVMLNLCRHYINDTFWCTFISYAILMVKMVIMVGFMVAIMYQDELEYS